MESVKGFKDKLGKEAEKAAFIREVARQTFEKYNFIEVETPVVEYEEFVKGENQNDEAVSDIFRLQDRGKRNLALRYEFTFQLKRIAQNQKLLGFITDYDIRKILEKREDIFSKKIKDIMNPKPIFVYSDMKAADVLAVMQNREKAIVVLPVINRKKRVAGIIHMQDILAKGL